VALLALQCFQFHLEKSLVTVLQAVANMHTQHWSEQATKLLFGLAATGIACSAVVHAAEERLNPGVFVFWLML